ncbi:hypothetical protein D1007_46906 [Hordeum vulgare]|nr:hypothetical protein D1007_46906 [Hordeum vulgare]
MFIDQAVEKSSPLPSDDPGDQQDGGGAKRPFVLVSADPGKEGEGSSVQGCGGEISSSIPIDGKTFVEPRQTARDTKVCTEFSRGWSAGVHHIWEVSFSISKDASKVDQRGSLVVHHSSGWATIRDVEGDILAGSYLMPKDLRIGLELEMDGLLVLLIKPDLFERDCGEKIASDPPRVGGKFWVLADHNSDSDIEEEIPPCSPVPSPVSLASPAGMSVECMTQRDFQLPMKKMDVPRPKPWIGPLPKSTIAVREAFLAATIVADGMGHDSVPKIELQAGYMAQPGSRGPDDARVDCQEEANIADLPVADKAVDQCKSILAVWQEGHQVDTKFGSDSQPDSRRSVDAREDCQEESNFAELPVADKAEDQFESDSVVRQEGHQADSKVGSDSAVRAFLKTPRVGFPRQNNTRAPRVHYLRPLVMSGKDVPAQSQQRAPAASQQVSGPAGPKRGGYRGRWGGRGGGRILPPNAGPVAVDKESAQKPADIPLTATIGGVASTVAVDKDIGPPRIEGADRPTKWARKKEKMTCYRCGENGHFVSECSAVLSVHTAVDPDIDMPDMDGDSGAGNADKGQFPSQSHTASGSATLDSKEGETEPAAGGCDSWGSVTLWFIPARRVAGQTRRFTDEEVLWEVRQEDDRTALSMPRLVLSRPPSSTHLPPCLHTPAPAASPAASACPHPCPCPPPPPAPPPSPPAPQLPRRLHLPSPLPLPSSSARAAAVSARADAISLLAPTAPRAADPPLL